MTVMVPNSLGPAELLGMYGTDEQKEYYLPRLASGEDIPCFCLTEPEVGSDAANVRARGVVYKDKSGELMIKMNWEKRYITLGPIATLMGIAFQLEDPEGLLPEGAKEGMSMALIPTDTPGITIGEVHKPMDMQFPNGPNFGKDVCIPLKNIIGGPEKAGQGWKMLNNALAVGRSVSLPSLSAAAAKKCSLIAGGYSRARKQFDTQIGDFEIIGEALGRIAGTTYMMDAVRQSSAQLVDQDAKPAVASAIAKLQLTDAMRRVVVDTYDILGGKAIMQGPKNPMGDMYKGIFIGPTVEGANPVTKGLVVFGQGAFRAHPQMRKMVESANDNDEKKAKKEFGRAFRGFLMNWMGSATRSVFYSMKGGGGRVPKNIDPSTKKYFKQINKLSASFNFAANLSIATVGGNLKRKELVSARLGEAYSNLLLAAWTLKYFHDRGAKKEELPLVQWVMEDRLHQSEKNLKELCRNYPKFAGMNLGKLMKPAIVWGEGRHKGPSDELTLKVAQIIRSPGPLLDSLTKGVHISENPDDPVALIAKASKMVVETEHLEKKIKSGFSKEERKSHNRESLIDAAVEKEILSKHEAEMLRETDKVCRQVIEVDKFEPAPQPDPGPMVEQTKKVWGLPGFKR
jgi:acyl-CoA dehydrogenase